MKKKIYNSYDESYKELWNAVLDARTRLREAAHKVIIRQGVINLYPAGPDQEKAIKDCEEAKQSLLCAIGHYDGRMQELNEDYNKFSAKFEECRTWHPTRMITSHEIIELAYEQTIRG